ncbi:hypothetical protein OG417_50260 [Actinoallomurus sp. NBC_01490]|uniref:hypothetical protein n=1 Tax=Actinoallomurus sp. NBC_01490 TaxID=2903557 RepID=UPI002E310A30|nr:hypothetical protein [Actinoallomurus sp. NBC_01490]
MTSRPIRGNGPRAMATLPKPALGLFAIHGRAAGVVPPRRGGRPLVEAACQQARQGHQQRR